MSEKKKAAIFCSSEANVDRVYGGGRYEKLAEISDLSPQIINPENFDQHREMLAEVELVFSTWGMWELSQEQLDVCTNLRAVFYGAGSVQGFARPLLERGITVMSAWAANAIPVAEYTVAQIVLASKDCFRFMRECANYEQRLSADSFVVRGLYGMRVSLIGAGMIGCLVAKMLQSFRVDVCIVDPYKSAEEIAAMGATQISIEEAFATSAIVSNHLPNIPATVAMMTKTHFASMPKGAYFINTGRGAQLIESDLHAVLSQRRDITALLDVTDPELPPQGSPFYDLENVYLTPHIAGSIGDEVWRMADYVIEEFQRWSNGEDLHYAVDLEMLKTMA